MAALFISSIVITATLGLTCGVNKLMHRHCFNKDNKRRDLEPSFPALIHINGSTTTLPECLAGPGALTILSSEDSANETATFQWGQHGEQAEGVLKGFPVRSAAFPFFSRGRFVGAGSINQRLCCRPRAKTA